MLRLLVLALAVLVVAASARAETPTRVDSVGGCKVYHFRNAGTYGPFDVARGIMRFSIDGDTTSDTTTLGASATVTGCVTYGTGSQTCSCDLYGGTADCAVYDGSYGRTGFTAAAPRTVTVNVLSATTNGSFAICSE